MERVAPLQARVCFSIFIQIGGWVGTASGLTFNQDHSTLSDFQENADSSSTVKCMKNASPHLFPIHDFLATNVLRTQYGSTEKTEDRVLSFII